ncbi:MAG TPA: NnrS family protein [Terriglobia bacterium]|nr:NnrS family protein [Terriglobia bacterium]
MPRITASTRVADILEICPSARGIFDRYGLKGCGGREGPAESLSFFARVHQVDMEALLKDLNVEVENPSKEDALYKESLADTIYRRFFKGGIVIVLTVGGLWGVINLVQIAVRKNLLQPALVPAIHAHAHAMIFGWVGLFVMGFAYQSFPRFKYTTLWRPGLANLTFFLMLLGIGARAGAEMLQPRPVGIGLGALSAIAEFIAIGLFLLIISKTAGRSLEPHSPYEKFIFGALAWFLIQAVFSDFFFFAKATAGGGSELFQRIALLDPPLRDIQLFGFAAMIIAGVSQRFVPVVYGLGKPKHDRQGLIFVLMNGSLILDIFCYVGLYSTGNSYFVAGLEFSYLLMLAWAVLLVFQLRVFTKTSEPDRSWKFIRAAYVWLIIALGMMPFFIPYSVWTHQFFAHAYWAAHRHAFTVGFISMMILGVSSRIVPILAGVSSRQISSLWGPFILLNVGCLGRVVLEVLTDHLPRIAYPLMGTTGFLEITALAWWGIGLWRVMNLSKTQRTNLLVAPVPVGSK